MGNHDFQNRTTHRSTRQRVAKPHKICRQGGIVRSLSCSNPTVVSKEILPHERELHLLWRWGSSSTVAMGYRHTAARSNLFRGT